MSSELSTCFRKCLGSFAAVGVLSGASNILALTGSVFMLAVYDRVIPSGSVPTLVAIGLLGLAAYAVQAMVDVFRGRMLTRIGLVIKESLNPRIYDIAVRNAASGQPRTGAAARDLEQVSTFLSSMAPTALFDLPWLPLYLFICFAFHFYIGVAVTAGALLLIALTVIANWTARRPTEALNDAINRRNTLLTASQGQAETLQSMGMTLNLSAGWNSVGASVTHWTRSLADTTTLLGTISRVSRMVLQSGVLAIGALLVIEGNATGGIMIAASILSARALAPIELAIAHWKSFVATRQSWARLGALFDANPPESRTFEPPRPVAELRCENVSVAIAGQRRFLLRDVSLHLPAGEALAIVGPNGSGKSTLARALVGLWPPAAGAVRLDGLSLADWSATERGRFIGYLPQVTALFEGTIAENIARFDPDADSAAIIAVARAAGVHDLISRMPAGYLTRIGEDGAGLSAGQAQRIGLARALYGEPFVVVLDEPNSALDGDGDAALSRAIAAIRDRGGIAVVITHRPSLLSAMNQILVLQEGRVARYGRTEEVMDYLYRKPPAVAASTAA